MVLGGRGLNGRACAHERRGFNTKQQNGGTTEKIGARFVQEGKMAAQSKTTLSSQLLYMGRDYPLGYQYFRDKCNASFNKNRHENDPEKVDMLLKKGDYVLAELEALYKLKKYRTLKRRYYSNNQN